MSPGDSVLRLAERVETLSGLIVDPQQLRAKLGEMFLEFSLEVSSWQSSRVELLVASLRRLASNINPPKEV